MPVIIKLKNSQTAGNTPTLSNTGETGINEADGNFFFRNSAASTVEKANLRRIDPMFDEINPYALRAPTMINGGGQMVYDGANFYWSGRFIIISNSNSSRTATAGYFDVNIPAAGTVITGVGGYGNQTVTSVGVPIPTWSCLYYILPYGSTSTTLAANFRIAGYTAGLIVPHSWVPICWQNGDTGILNLNKFSMSPGDVYDASKSQISQMSGRNSQFQGRSLFFR